MLFANERSGGRHIYGAVLIHRAPPEARQPVIAGLTRNLIYLSHKVPSKCYDAAVRFGTWLR